CARTLCDWRSLPLGFEVGARNGSKQGDSTGTVTNFASISLAAVRAALARYTVAPDPAGPTFAPGARNPFQDELTVQLEVTGDGVPMTGIDRRVFTSIDDPTLVHGFPKAMSAGGEAPIRYASLT